MDALNSATAKMRAEHADRTLAGTGNVVDGPLRNIERRITTHTAQMRELTAKLSDHANRVHGPAENNHDYSGEPAAGEDMPAMQRILYVLEVQSAVLSDLAMQAGRNCTLA